MTIRTIPASLKTHLAGSGTSLCYLLKITTKDGTSFGVASLDQDVAFDDGGGFVTYQAAIGIEQSAIASSANLEVNNSEGKLLLVDTSPVTEEQIAAGALDFAKYVLYRVNWQDPSQGAYIVQSGILGSVSAVDGLAGLVELRGMSQQLKQSFVHLYSLDCRATFGSQVGDEKFPCLFDASSLWSSDTVLSVDATEPDRIFTATTTPSATGPNGALPFVPGLVKFTSGNNAGLTIEIDDVTGDVITLRFHTPYDIQATDGYDIRPDCGKKFEDHCIAHFDNGLNFRGEPLIPLADESNVGTPGANYPTFPVGVVIA